MPVQLLSSVYGQSMTERRCRKRGREQAVWIGKYGIEREVTSPEGVYATVFASRYAKQFNLSHLVVCDAGFRFGLSLLFRRTKFEVRSLDSEGVRRAQKMKS